MHPAPSVIVFTTLSGIGFGLLFWLGLGMPAPTGWAGVGFFFMAFALSVGGLLASTFHLGRPERAWRALTQWKSSWLSREGICAVACLLLMGVYAAALVLFGTRLAVLGYLGAALALGTVFTTSMIYAQLKTVPRWNTPLTSALFLAFSLAGGALLSGNRELAVFLLLVAAAVQIAWWMLGDTALANGGTNLATATGLGGTGAVRAFEPPHTGTNYLLREFVHEVGRKHALKLRAIALVAGFALPILLLLSGSVILLAFAVLVHLGGIAASRWLFFAEAEHVVGLYYGKRAA
ncbi:MAG: DmsC/YnfH family molybdoenzyme membrane anchor subunit [Pseudomonadota bacterium]